MKKIIYCTLALVWSTSVVAMEKPAPSAPPFEPASKTDIPEYYEPPRINPEELPSVSSAPFISEVAPLEPTAPWSQQNVKAYVPSFEQPWYQRYWNTTKELAQTSWNLIKAGGSRVADVVRRINRKINYD